MALLKIKDFDPNYKETFGGYDIKGLSVYSEVNNEKIGTVNDLLIDEQGRFRYFIVDLGFWGFGKKVLLPIGRSQIDSEGKHVYALGFTKDQAENLPEFNESLRIDNDYEERVRGAYQPQTHDRPQTYDRPQPHTSIPSAPPVPPVPPAGAPESLSTAGQVPPPGLSGGYAAPSQPSQPAPSQVNYPQGYPRYETQPERPPLPRSQPPIQPIQPIQPVQPTQPVQRSVEQPRTEYYYAEPPQPRSQPQPPVQPPIQPPVQPEPHSQSHYVERQSFQQPVSHSATNEPTPSYDYQRDPGMYDTDEQRHSILHRFEQRLREKRMSERR